MLHSGGRNSIHYQKGDLQQLTYQYHCYYYVQYARIVYDQFHWEFVTIQVFVNIIVLHQILTLAFYVP